MATKSLTGTNAIGTRHNLIMLFLSVWCKTSKWLISGTSRIICFSMFDHRLLTLWKTESLFGRDYCSYHSSMIRNFLSLIIWCPGNMALFQEADWLILTFYLLSCVIMGWHIIKCNRGLCLPGGPPGFMWLNMAEDSYDYGPAQNCQFTSTTLRHSLHFCFEAWFRSY